MSDAGVTYAEIRAWAVFLEVFTARDIADAMHVHPAVGDRALKALLWHGIVEPTGDVLELNDGPERIYRHKPLPPGPKEHATDTPPEISVPAALGGDPLKVRRGLPVDGMTGGASLRARRQKLSVTGGTRKH